MDGDTADQLLKCTKALLALQLQALNQIEEPAKPEILLSRAGLSPRDIAQLLGKSPAAVAKAIQRAGKGGA